jgi:hypothetical protein
MRASRTVSILCLNAEGEDYGPHSSMKLKGACLFVSNVYDHIFLHCYMDGVPMLLMVDCF